MVFDDIVTTIVSPLCHHCLLFLLHSSAKIVPGLPCSRATGISCPLLFFLTTPNAAVVMFVLVWVVVGGPCS